MLIAFRKMDRGKKVLNSPFKSQHGGASIIGFLYIFCKSASVFLSTISLMPPIVLCSCICYQ